MSTHSDESVNLSLEEVIGMAYPVANPVSFTSLPCRQDTAGGLNSFTWRNWYFCLTGRSGSTAGLSDGALLVPGIGIDASCFLELEEELGLFCEIIS